LGKRYLDHAVLVFGVVRIKTPNASERTIVGMLDFQGPTNDSHTKVSQRATITDGLSSMSEPSSEEPNRHGAELQRVRLADAEGMSKHLTQKYMSLHKRGIEDVDPPHAFISKRRQFIFQPAEEAEFARIVAGMYPDGIEFSDEE
jgi:hypothetical protein